MVMLNIAKITLIKATEYCLLKRFSFRVFLPAELFIIYPILIWSRLRSLVITWTKIFSKILNNECELKVPYQENSLAEKKVGCCFFWPKGFHGVSLLMYGKWGRIKLWGWCMVFWQHYVTLEKRTMRNRFL